MAIQKRVIGVHVLGWLLFSGLIVGFTSHNANLTESPGRFIYPIIMMVVVYMSLFYINAYVLIPKLYLHRKYVLYFTAVLLLFAGVYFLKPFDRVMNLHMGARSFPPRPIPPGAGSEHLPHPVNFPPHDGRGPHDRPGHLDIVSVVLFLAIWSLSTAMQVIRQWRITERRALQAEADKINAELSFLKAQINPHFLFNTLNNIYSLAITKSDQTPNAVLKLSHILRYITDDVHRDLVPLQSEIDCVTNYIELQKLRLTNKVKIEFSIRGDASRQQIAPLIFMTFIENAFKYGISSHEPCTITIEIRINDRTIDFYCQNRIMVKNTDERVGVGINNVQKRLDYQYQARHLLRMNNENGIFTVHLTIMD